MALVLSNPLLSGRLARVPWTLPLWAPLARGRSKPALLVLWVQVWSKLAPWALLAPGSWSLALSGRWVLLGLVLPLALWVLEGPAVLW